MTVVPCILDKVRNWDTVEACTVTWIKKAQTNATEWDEKVLSLLWNPQIPVIEHTVNLKQKDGKMRKALVLLSLSFTGTFVFREQLRALSWMSSISKSPWNLWRSSGSMFRCFINIKECSQPSMMMCTVNLAKLLANNIHCLTSVPTESCPRQVSCTFKRSRSTLVSCAGSCCCFRCELVFNFLPTLLIFRCFDPFIIVSFNIACLIFGCFGFEEVIDFIFHLFFGLPTALCVLYFVLSSGFHPAAFITPFSSLISMSFFCVFWSSIGLFCCFIRSWLHVCFSSCFQPILLLRECLLSISSSASFMKEMSLSWSQSVFELFQVHLQSFRDFLSLLLHLSLFRFSTSLFHFLFIFVVFFVFSLCLYDEAEHAAQRRLNHSFVFFWRCPCFMMRKFVVEVTMSNKRSRCRRR